MTDFRALCAELLLALEGEEYTHWTHSPDKDDLVLRARAALVEPKPEEPTDEELYDYWISTSPEFGCADPIGFARAVLSRFGHQPAPVAEGEVAELISKLQKLCSDLDYDDCGEEAGYCYRAADLLQRQYPQPVPVNERLPSPEDCDAEGRCWWWHPSHAESGYWEGWMLRPRAWGVGRYDFDDRLVHTHWLPAHALPLPTTND